MEMALGAGLAAGISAAAALMGCSAESARPLASGGGGYTPTTTYNTGLSGGSTTTSGSGGVGGFNTGTGGNVGGNPNCSTALEATIRDFRIDHPDFETFTGQAAMLGLVEIELGPDGKPVYAHPGGTGQTTGPDQFAQWYEDTDGVNQAFPITLTLEQTSPGAYGYDSSAFFPIDGQGWGDEGNPHNFHFTTEIHTTFTYEGGEVFNFSGDDDLWLFVNGRLALDLGGTHPELPGEVNFDAQATTLGITPGLTYPMDIFHAERHTVDSNFTIETTINCFMPPPN